MWRNPASWPLTRRVVVLAVAATYLPLGYVLYGWGPDHSAPQHKAPTYTVVNTYESPCYVQVRTARGIPALSVDASKGLLAWEQAHQGTIEAADYHAALDHCDATQPVGKWDWDAKVLVNQETVR
jgi:hypothetical protein